jgi:hypothetical protein
MCEWLFCGLDPKPLFSLVRWILCERDGALGEKI